MATSSRSPIGVSFGASIPIAGSTQIIGTSVQAYTTTSWQQMVSAGLQRFQTGAAQEPTRVAKMGYPSVTISVEQYGEQLQFTAHGCLFGNEVVRHAIPVDESTFDDVRDDIAALCARTFDALLAIQRSRGLVK